MRLRSVVVRFSVLLLIMGCGGDITGPFTTNVEMARRAWLRSRPTDYSFEFATATEWGKVSPFNGDPGDDFYSVTVAGGQVTGFSSSRGRIVSPSGPTLEDEWQRILAASADGSLKTALFSREGIPLEWLIDSDEWADDAVRVWVRNFERKR
jgi:hypothetical protein